MVNRHKSKRSFYKELRDERTSKLNNNQEGRQLLALYGLSLVGEMSPKFGIGHAMMLSVYQDNGQLEEQVVPSTLDNISQHLGLAANQRIEEIQTFDIPDEYRARLIDSELKLAKEELSKYLAKVRPLLLERNIYLYTIPLPRVETVPETGQFVRAKSVRVLCALPISRQAAEDYGCSQEEIKEIAPLVAWLIPELVRYGKIKNADRLIVALDGWIKILTPQQNEKLCTSVKKHERPVMNKKVAQLLLL
jgi:hypothetical protein